MRIRFWLGPDSIANETRATNDSLTRASGSWGVSGTVSFSGRSITTSTGNLKITCYNCWGSLSANLFVDARWSWFSIDACARVSASARANIDLRADFRSGIAKTPRYRFFSLPIHRYGLAGIASIDPFIFGDISASTYLYSSTPLWATYGFDASAGVTGVVKLLGSNKCGSSSGSASVNSHGFKKSAIKIAWSGNVEMQLMPGVGVKVSLFGRGPEATIGPELYLGLGSRYSAYCPSRTSYAIYGGVDLQLQKKDVLNLLYKRFTNWLCW